MGKRMCAIAAAVLLAAALTSCGGSSPENGDDNSSESTAASAKSVLPSAAERMTVAVSEKNTNEFGAPERVEIDLKMPDGYKLSEKKAVNVNAILQTPELPTGCEITALTELLVFYGFDADKVEMADIFMANDRIGYYTMREAYIGDPHQEDGFGCSAPVIVKAANDYFSYLGSDWYASDLTGSPIEEMYYQIEQGRPVIVWTTINQVEIPKEYQFTLGCGEDLLFNPVQHCVVLYGFAFDEKVVHVADPLVGNKTYDMERFERIYNSMDKQAVVLCGNEESAGVDFTNAQQKEAWLKCNRVFVSGERVWFRQSYDALEAPMPVTEPPATTSSTAAITGTTATTTATTTTEAKT